MIGPTQQSCLSLGGGGTLDSEKGLWSELRVAARTDVGRVRSRNEDALAVLEEWNWLVLSDGMGGLPGGDVASRVAVGIVSEHCERHVSEAREVASAVDLLRRAIAAANA
jgi:PPM family protein phosphatase